jgi:hypothetical protein
LQRTVEEKVLFHVNSVATTGPGPNLTGGELCVLKSLKTNDGGNSLDRCRV